MCGTSHHERLLDHLSASRPDRFASNDLREFREIARKIRTAAGRIRELLKQPAICRAADCNRRYFDVGCTNRSSQLLLVVGGCLAVRHQKNLPLRECGPRARIVEPPDGKRGGRRYARRPTWHDGLELSGDVRRPLTRAE